MKTIKTGTWIVIPVAVILLFACRDNNPNVIKSDRDSAFVERAEERMDSADARRERRREENFVVNAVENNLEEIAWLKEGLNYGKDSALKTAAHDMMADHQRIIQNFRDYAKRKGLSLNDVDSVLAINLDEKPGPDWDEEWADEIGDQDFRLIRNFERARNYIRDDELRKMVDESLPVLRAHLDRTKRLENKLSR